MGKKISYYLYSLLFTKVAVKNFAGPQNKLINYLMICQIMNEISMYYDSLRIFFLCMSTTLIQVSDINIIYDVIYM